MPTKRYARALISRQNVPFDEWMEVMRQQSEGAVPKDYVHRVAKTVLRRCDPKEFLLSHATIVASVDTYAPAGTKTGRQMNRGVQTDVRWSDFRIKPECQEIVNNNGDAWERSLLLSSYRTFVGAANYLEHIQVPELNKGFIVDAVARDLGKTCYIDILVATERKHQKLVADILSGELSALSMGCISLFTICTKCGNVASDDSQLCPCVQYEGKHSEYFDEEGQKHKISELIGHVSVPNSNQFIEASWVKSPAFTGAVRRNFLDENSPHIAALLKEASEIRDVKKTVSLPIGVAKAASIRVAEGQDQGLGDVSDLTQDIGDSQDQGQGETQSQGSGGTESDSDDSSAKKDADPKKSDDSKIDEYLEKAQEQILELLIGKLSDKLAPKPEDVASVAPPTPDLTAGNDNLVMSSNIFTRRLNATFPNSPSLRKWAEKAWKTVHVGGVPAIRAASMKPRDLIVLSWIEDCVRGRDYSPSLYKLAMKVGPISNYPSERSFIAACAIKHGKPLTSSDQKFLVWKGRIAAILVYQFVKTLMKLDETGDMIMRERSTWQGREASTSRTAAEDIYDMNGEHPQPSATEYENGNPDSWAETPASYDNVAEEYDGDHVKRNELGFGEFRKDTWDGAGQKPWGTGKKYDNRTAAARKATATKHIASELLRTANQKLVQNVALAFMSMPDAAVVSTLRAIEASSPAALSKESRYKRALACTKVAARMLGSLATEAQVEKLSRDLFKVDDPTLRSIVQTVASVKVAQDQDEEGDEDKNNSGKQAQQSQEDQAPQAQQAQKSEQDETEGQQAQDMQEGAVCLSEADEALLSQLLGEAPAAPAGVSEVFQPPVAPGAVVVPAVAASESPEITFDDDSDLPMTPASTAQVASLESLFSDDSEVRAQREIVASQAPGFDVRTASSKRTNEAKKLGAVQGSKPAAPSAALESIWDRVLSKQNLGPSLFYRKEEREGPRDEKRNINLSQKSDARKEIQGNRAKLGRVRSRFWTELTSGRKETLSDPNSQV